MAHFARINARDIVEHVHVVRDEDAPTEAAGQAYLSALHGYPPDRFAQCSYNGTIRARFPGIGYTWDAARGAFIAPRPAASWVLDAVTTEWQPPAAKPTTPGQWRWDEGLGAWVDFTGAVDNVTFTLRFTDAEQARIIPSADPYVQGLLAKLKANAVVAVKHPTVVNGVAYLQANGFLDGPGRGNLILNPTP